MRHLHGKGQMHKMRRLITHSSNQEMGRSLNLSIQPRNHSSSGSNANNTRTLVHNPCRVRQTNLSAHHLCRDSHKIPGNKGK